MRLPGLSTASDERVLVRTVRYYSTQCKANPAVIRNSRGSLTSTFCHGYHGIVLPFVYLQCTRE